MIWLRFLPYFTAIFFWLILVDFVDFNGRYGQDAHAYFNFGNALFGRGEYVGLFIWPAVYPIFGGLFGFQLTSLLSLLVAIWAVGHLLKERATNPALLSIFQTLCVACSPMMLRSGVLVMTETLCIALLALGMVAVQKGPGRWTAIAALTFSLAVYCRYQAALIAAPFVIFSFWQYCQSFFGLGRENPQRAMSNALYLPVILACACAGPLLQLLADLPVSPAQYSSGHMTFWRVSNFWQTEFVTVDGHLQYRFMNLFAVTQLLWHPAFVPLGLIFLGFVRRKDFQKPSPISLLMIIGVVIYLVLVAGLAQQNSRFLILAMPFARAQQRSAR